MSTIIRRGHKGSDGRIHSAVATANHSLRRNILYRAKVLIKSFLIPFQAIRPLITMSIECSTSTLAITIHVVLLKNAMSWTARPLRASFK